MCIPVLRAGRWRVIEGGRKGLQESLVFLSPEVGVYGRVHEAAECQRMGSLALEDVLCLAETPGKRLGDDFIL